MANKEFSVRFWGTRGAVASPNRQSFKYGGNTICVEVNCGGRILVFDAGSGFRPLGLDLRKREISNFDVFFTHFHYDHICGFPFFAPFFNPKAKIRLWSGHLNRRDATRRGIRDYMKHPYFPVGPEVFEASLDYRDFKAGEILRPARGIVIATCPLNHPGGATAYRVNFDGRSFCYVTDTEHTPDGLNQTIIDLAEGADMMVYDATYSDTEYPRFVDYGHSTWQEGVRLCKAANVRRLGIFHHRPSRTDAKLDAIGRLAKKQFPGSFVTRDGQRIRL